jgi:hypothetical protein
MFGHPEHVAPVSVWASRHCGEYGPHAFQTGRQDRNGLTHKHIDRCALLMQPISKSQKLYLIATSLFADQQELAARD